ncbi:MAG: serine/threonine protein kinase, partial [Myxococcales bacterium]|nr:serine/threonine protein kinase [Myxococcales bacterium]
MASAERPLIIGRYTLAAPVGAGGMATIYLGRQVGAAGFSRVIAVKRLHPHYASEPEFVAMFLDEARLAARVRHRHVVETLDVVHEGGETVIVLEYVDGESLAGLVRALHAAGERMPLPIAARIMMEACLGLHAAHEVKGADGSPLGVVHRDVSPANVLVGTDGCSRVTDFGIALASDRLSHTKSGQVKGKPAYMAPEQLAGRPLTRASDIYAAGVVLWELCAGRRAYEASNEGALYAQVLTGRIPALEEVAPWVPRALADVVVRALERDPDRRFASALEMAQAIERAIPIANPAGVGAFVEQRATEALAKRRRLAASLDPNIAPPVPLVLPAPEQVNAPSRPPPPARDDTQQR